MPPPPPRVQRNDLAISPTSLLFTKAAHRDYCVTLSIMNTNLTNVASSSASASATQNAGASNVKEGSARDRR